MLELSIHHEDALLANILYSTTAREVVKELGLEAKHFTDFHLTRSTRARYFTAIMASPSTGGISAADQLHPYLQGDAQRLLSLGELALSVTPDWENLIESIKRDWLDREIERLKKAGDYDGILAVTQEFNNSKSSNKSNIPNNSNFANIANYLNTPNISNEV